MIEPERPHEIFAKEERKVLEPAGDRQRAFQIPKKRIGKTQVLDHDPVVRSRAIDGRGNTWPGARIDFAIRFQSPRQKKISVAGKLCAQRRAEIRQGLMKVTAAQQNLSRAEGTGGYDYLAAYDRTRLGKRVGLGRPLIESVAVDCEWPRFSGSEIELAKVNAVTRALNWINWLDLLDLMQRINFCTILLGEWNVVEIEGVLCMNVTAEHAIATVNTTLLNDTLAINFFGPGVDANLHQLRFAAGVLRGGNERLGARRHVEVRRRRQRPGFEHVARLAVERIEDVAGATAGPARICEDLFWGANVNVEIDERAATDTACLNDVDVFEGAIIKQPQIAVVPKRARYLTGRARKIFLAPTLAALEDAN